jgi:hypothetical protein
MGHGAHQHPTRTALSVELCCVQEWAVAAHVLGEVGAVCALHGDKWGYHHAVDALFKLYKFPQYSVTRALMHGTTKSMARAGGWERLCMGRGMSRRGVHGRRNGQERVRMEEGMGGRVRGGFQRPMGRLQC